MPSNQRLPLSAAQYGIWLGQQLNPDSPAYWAAEAIELNGVLDLAAFENVLDQEINATQTLQMAFGSSGGEPWQCANPTPSPSLKRIDFSLEADPWQAAQRWMRQDLQRRKGLSSQGERPQPIFATTMLQLGVERQLWYLCVHHIALDGFGFSLFTQRVATAYTAWAQGISSRRPADADLAQVIAEDQRYQTTRAGRDRTFWLERLAAAPPAITLSPAQDFCDHSIKRSITLPRVTLDRWKHAAHACGVDWSAWLLAAISAWMQHSTGRSGFRLGLPVMGRLGSVALDIPCMMMNIVPLVIEIQPEHSMSTLCQQIASELRRTRPHQRYRYEHLKQDLSLAGEQRLFGPVVNIMPFEHPCTFGPLSARFHPVAAGPVEDLAISIIPLPDGLRLDMEANPASYSAEQLAQHQSDLLHILECLLDAEQQPLSQRLTAIPARSRADSRLRGEPLTQAPKPILELFVSRARTRPHHPALEQDGEIRTYAELLVDVQRLAWQLRHHGVGPESRVVLLLPRHADTITAMLAILWAGGAYVPLDPDGPAARIAMVLDDVQPTLALSRSHYAQQVPITLTLLCLDKLDAPAAIDTPSLEHPIAVAEQALAYFIYTSGTTGKPNGVMISRQALAHFVASASQRYEMSADDRTLQFAPLHFDASVEEIFLTLCAGATLVLRNEAMLDSMPQFLETLARWHISVLDLPTAFWHELSFAIGQGQQRLPDTIRLVIIGGEAALAERVARWRTTVSPQVVLLNTYGPTEATVICSTAVLAGPALISSSDETVPIGSPLPGVDLIVVDEQLRPCPPGQAGELCIIGPTLAQGYWERENTSTQRFITLNTLPDAPRAYRSGDRVLLAADGQLRYLGRLDDEFKLSGHRIDPAEVETALLGYPGIREAAVVGLTLAQGLKQLVGFVVVEETANNECDIPHLRSHLLERLAAPAVPSRYVLLEQLPRNTNGKIDRSVLRQHPDLEYAAPVVTATPMENTVMAVWQDVLGLAQIRPEDDFFASGGKSLQAIQVANRLGLALQREVAVSALFRHRTVADLAQALSAPERHRPPNATPDPLAPCLLLQRGEGLPLFCIHPAEGLSWCYLGLAASLPELSLYGLQASGLSGNPSPSFTTMIDDYLARIREQQPQGPYRLLGWSSGGGIAHALACTLQTQGEAVELLAMMDAYPADIWANKPEATRRDALVNLLDVIGGSENDADGSALDEAELAALITRPGSVLAAYNIGQLIEVSLHNMQLYRQAQHPLFLGDILFFHATQRSPQAPNWQRWQTYVSGQIQIVDINSTHTGMSLPQPLAVIGQVLARHLLPRPPTGSPR